MKQQNLRSELQNVRGFCARQYFAPDKCTDSKLCGKMHVDRCFYPCIHYFAGNCKYGFNCHFSHSIRRQIPRPEPKQ